MGLAGGGARRSGSRYRTRCAVVLRRLRLRLPRLRLRLWDRVQLSVLRLWLWDRLQLSGLHRLQLPGIRLWLWHRLQLSGLRLWQRHCPPSSLRRRLASRLVKSRTKASRRVSAERAPSLTLQARRSRALRGRFIPRTDSLFPSPHLRFHRINAPATPWSLEELNAGCFIVSASAQDRSQILRPCVCARASRRRASGKNHP